MPYAPCSMPPLYLNKAGKWARFGRTQGITDELGIQKKESGETIGTLEDWNNGMLG
jgi:hypothetical protein